MELQGLSKIGRRVTRRIVFFFLLSFFLCPFGLVLQPGGEKMTTMWALLGMLAMSRIHSGSCRELFSSIGLFEALARVQRYSAARPDCNINTICVLVLCTAGSVLDAMA